MSYNTNMGVTFDTAVANNISRRRKKTRLVIYITKGKKKKNIDNLKSVAKIRQVYLINVRHWVERKQKVFSMMRKFFFFFCLLYKDTLNFFLLGKTSYMT